MRTGSPSVDKGTPTASGGSPGARLLSKLKSMTNSNKATASGDSGKTSPNTTTQGQQQRPSAPSTESAGLPGRRSSITPPRPSNATAPAHATATRGPSSSSSLAAGAKPSRPAPAGGKAPVNAWAQYRESRLSKLAKWLQIFLVALLFVALYCGDLTPATMKSTAVFQGFSAQLSKLSEATSGLLPARLPLPRRLGLKAAWNTVTDAVPPQVPILTPMQSPALQRGTGHLYSGDYIYSCVAPKSKGNGKGAAEACAPTFLHLKDDGTLLLAHGTSPSKPYKTIWTSKTPKPCGKKGTKQCACQGQYEALYNKDGSLEVKRGCGKRVWHKRKFFQPKALRPWPLTE